MIEFVSYILEQNKFFVYWVVSWIVIYFFEWEKVSLYWLVKVIIYWIITSFAYNIVVWYEVVDILNDNKVMVATIASSTLIQLFLIPILLDKDSLKKVKEFLLSKIK